MKLDRLMRLPERVPCDKRIHALVGVVVAAMLLIIGFTIEVTLMSIIAVSWGIEIYQLITKSGQYDNFDAIAVLIGGLLVMLPWLLK